MSVEYKTPEESLTTLLSIVSSEDIKKLKLAQATYKPVPSVYGYIDSGADSYVFREGDFAFKFYCKGIFNQASEVSSEYLLEDYLYATNKLSEITHLRKIYLDNIQKRLFVNPILLMSYQRKYNQHISISRFIIGEKIQTIAQDLELNRQIRRIGNEVGINGLYVLSFNAKVIDDCVIVTDISPSPHTIIVNK